jgi:hypothetical protein
MANNFDLSNLALQALCPSNEILYDDKGLPSIMVKIPKMSYAELGLGASTATHPAFIVNGQEVPAIYISKYQNIIQNGRAYSLPGQDPHANINFDNALAACTAKGAGWHLMTMMEWGMIAQWCKNNGSMPKGNNNYGKDTADSVYQAIPSMARDGSNRIQRVATGTGPLSWSHDGTPSGIWDLNGNVTEWCGGIRTYGGELQILANNNGADGSIAQTAASAQWMAINASDGTLITPDGSGTTSGSIKCDWVGGHLQYDTTISDTDRKGKGCTFESITCSANIGSAAQLLLQALGIFKYDSTAGAYLGDYFYIDNTVDRERSFHRGGLWYDGAYAGVFYSDGCDGRADANAVIGFRSAYCALPSA